MSRENGSSLLETLIVLSILLLLASATASSFTTTIHQYQIDLTSRELIHTLALARSEAIKRNVRITLSKNTAHWEEGWTLFVDANNNTIHDADELILLVSSSEKRWLIMNGNKGVANFVSYVPAGNTAQANNAWQAGTFTICPHSPAAHGYKIIINRGGRVRQEVADCET